MATKKKKAPSKQEKEVHVAAGHGHEAYVTHRLENSFALGISGGGRQSENGGSVRYGGYKSIPPADKAKFGKDAGGEPPSPHPDSADRSEKGWGGGKAPGGTPPPAPNAWDNLYDLPENASPDEVLDRVSALASEIYNDPKLKPLKPSARKQAAAEQAITRAQLAYHTTADKKKAAIKVDSSGTATTSTTPRGLNLKAVDTKSVVSRAFGPKMSVDSAKARGSRAAKPSYGQQAVDKVNARVPAAYRQAKGARFPKIGYGGDGVKGPRGVGMPSAKPLSDEDKKLTAQRQGGKRDLQPGQKVSKGKKTAQKFLNDLSPQEREWVNQQTEDPRGVFYGAKGNKVPGSYRNLQRYMDARQSPEGYDAPINKDGSTNKEHSTYKWLTHDGRGRRQSTNPKRIDKGTTDNLLKDRFTKGVVKKEGTKSKDRYKSLAPSHEDFGVGIRVPGIPSKDQLSDMFPDLTDNQILEMHESAKQSTAEFLDNTRMAHESRQSQILDNNTSAEKAAGDPNRVVFFTTSTGWPAVSVGSNSLLGQYVIKKRKKMVVDNKLATRAKVKGEFPPAVRDQHLVEVATGLSLGAQGRYGAFKHVGYRVGSKKSSGYGKVLPVGSQILRDSSGQPLYDRNGNLRYTEGFTRPFDARTSKEVGLRIYLG